MHRNTLTRIIRKLITDSEQIRMITRVKCAEQSPAGAAAVKIALRGCCFCSCFCFHLMLAPLRDQQP
jgi:hypothetical protein